MLLLVMRFHLQADCGDVADAHYFSQFNIFLCLNNFRQHSSLWLGPGNLVVKTHTTSPA